jgi:hypothetical protein
MDDMQLESLIDHYMAQAEGEENRSLAKNGVVDHAAMVVAAISRSTALLCDIALTLHQIADQYRDPGNKVTE